MRLFLTGTESFIGSVFWNLAQQAGHELSGLDVVPSCKPNTVQMDLRDPRVADQIPEGATIVHLAAVSTDPLCKANPLEGLDINITGTLNLAKAAVKQKCPQFVFASTEWVYGDVANDEVQSEDRPIDATRITSVYALSKLAGERVLALSGMENVTILRFGIVYGPREKNWSAVENLLESVRKGGPIKIGSLKTARRFIHVRDLCDGILASIGQRGHQVFNLTADRPIPLGEVLDMGQQLLGRNVEITESAPDKPSIRNPDNARARQILGWQPKVSFESGIKELLDYIAQRSPHA